jgi:transcriptional regulator with XRE-family HTH domain
MRKHANTRLGNRLRGLRDAAGVTQQELAGRMGIAQPALSKIESGIHEPRLATLEKYAAGLGLTLQRLLDGVGDESSGRQHG